MNLDGLLAGITHLSVNGRGPKDAYLFDPHRLALPCWARAVEEKKAPAVLLTLDRHFDLVPPVNVAAPGLSVLELDEYARRRADVRNYDHVLGAVEAGLISEVIAVARARPVGVFDGEVWRSSRGTSHLIHRFTSLDRLLEQSTRFERLLADAPHVILDIDLDCFTSPSDVDPLTPIPWPEPVIREFLCLRSTDFWSRVLSKCSALTIAREPLHCGGVIATQHLFEVVAQVLFVELLQADLP